MKISTKGRYGLRLLIDLTLNQTQGYISLAAVSERQCISARYLEQVAILLKQAGYIKSVKGASGGYALAKKPDMIFVGDVLRVLEGDMTIADPPCFEKPETTIKKVIRTEVYDKINECIAVSIDTHTIESLISAGIDGAV